MIVCLSPGPSGVSSPQRMRTIFSRNEPGSSLETLNSIVSSGLTLILSA